MTNSNNKGKVGEREVAALIREYGFNARRGQQYEGGHDSPDVIHSMPDIHVEVKRTEAFQLFKSFHQAQEDSKPGETPVVFHRRNDEPWIVVLRATDFLGMVMRLDEGEC
jgi:Holliday junction resolvase|tara:strand:+ start:15148 stop:15477 length:330 start_codon:yes stop_codon:yes gene_type:complete